MKLKFSVACKAQARLKIFCTSKFSVQLIIIIIIIRFHGLSKHSAFIAQLVAVHEFVQSVLEDLQ